MHVETPRRGLVATMTELPATPVRHALAWPAQRLRACSEGPNMAKTVAITLPSSAIRWLAVGAGIGLLAALAGAPALTPHTALAVDPTTTTPEHTITVSGTGRVTLTPNIADLRLGVNITRPTANQARDDAADAMTKVVAAIRAGGVADKDIQTSSLSLQPVYDYSTNGQGKLTGFQVMNIVAITVRDIAKVGDLVDASVKAGATSVDGVSFRVENETAAEGQARTAAVADAKAKAQALASAAGVTIAGVSSIVENSSTVPSPIPYAASAPARDAMSTPVSPGTTEIDIVVTVVFRIN
jgi:uncharacterized protein YggE